MIDEHDQEWQLAKVSGPDGNIGLFRFLKSQPGGWRDIPLSEEVSLTWKYTGVMPDETTRKRMKELEDSLEPILANGDTVLVMVMTVQGLREWCYYTRDYPAFMEELNRLLDGLPAYPIEIVHSHDPEWNYWHKFTDKLNDQ